MDPQTHPLEASLGSALRFFVGFGVPLAAAGIFYPPPAGEGGLMAYFLGHLAVTMLVVLWFVARAERRLQDPWFPRSRRRWLVSALSLLAFAVGLGATLATVTGFARYAPSLQHLLTLSALVIAGIASALYVGGRRHWGMIPAMIIGLAAILAGLGALAVYLNRVGFASDGGWVIDGDALRQLVAPATAVATLMAWVILWTASRRGGSRRAMRQI